MQTLFLFLSKFSVLLLLFTGAVLSVWGSYFAKEWAVTLKEWLLIPALLLYLVSGAIYIPTLLKEGVFLTSMIWNLVTTVGTLTLGVYVFHEQLTMIQIVGVFFGLISLVLLSWHVRA